MKLTQNNNLKPGDKVIVSTPVPNHDPQLKGCYPPPGTIGTVIVPRPSGPQVQWPKDNTTDPPHRWWIDYPYIELAGKSKTKPQTGINLYDPHSITKPILPQATRKKGMAPICENIILPPQTPPLPFSLAQQTWYVIDHSQYCGQTIYLLESEQDGENSPHIITTKQGDFLIETYNGLKEIDYSFTPKDTDTIIAILQEMASNPKITCNPQAHAYITAALPGQALSQDYPPGSSPDSYEHALQVQVQYILANLSHWQGSQARVIKLRLRAWADEA